MFTKRFCERAFCGHVSSQINILARLYFWFLIPLFVVALVIVFGLNKCDFSFCLSARTHQHQQYQPNVATLKESWTQLVFQNKHEKVYTDHANVNRTNFRPD